MNPDRIYREYRDDALANLFTAAEYKTFVAMPFGERFSYRSSEVYEQVFRAAAARANELGETQRKFAVPTRVDDSPTGAVTITEEIVVRILESHFFLGDLTFENAGVLLETGIAFGLKPNSRIILVTQGRYDELHFDIRNNSVLVYNPRDSVEALAKAFIRAAQAFEQECERYIGSIRDRLMPEAMVCLNFYASIQKSNPTNSLHFECRPPFFAETFGDEMGKVMFTDALRELIRFRLLRTEYVPGVSMGNDPPVDYYGAHATQLGWLLIEKYWPELSRQI